MEGDKKLSDLEAWKARAEYLDGLIRDTYKTIHYFLKEIVTPLNDRMINFNDRLTSLEAWVSERQRFESTTLKLESTTVETLRAIAQRVEKLEEVHKIESAPGSMLS